MKKNEIAIYTAIFGNYDDLLGPLVKVPGCDFYCFTDNGNLKASGYKVIKVKRNFDDPTRDARMYKCLPHKFLPDYEYSVWIDGSMIIKDPRVAELVTDSLKRYDLAGFKHTERDCIYDELEACVLQKKDDEQLMRKQVAKYKKEGYPKNNGLVETGVLIRKKTGNVIKHNEAWWEEIENNSKRDQLSFNYVAWKQNLEYGYMLGNQTFNPFFIWNVIHGRKTDILGAAFYDLLEENLKEREEMQKEREKIQIKKENELQETISRLESVENDFKLIHGSRLWKLRNKLVKYVGKREL